MLVIVATYRARVGEEDAIIALHEDKTNRHNLKASLYHSWRLLNRVDEPREFISIARFTNKQLAQAAIKDLETDGWFSRLASLMESVPTQVNYKVVWSLN